jgi:hypothetical protein
LVESGVKYHKPNQTKLHIILLHLQYKL